MKSLLLFLVASVPYVSAGCLPVNGGRILGRDLASADPRFAGLPATLTIGYGPNPGAQRVFAAAELDRIARANGLHLANVNDICFEFPLRAVSLAEATLAMRRSLPADATLELLETASFGVPAGELEFPAAALEPPNPAAGGSRIWRGFVRYAETRRAPFWARIVATVSYSAVVAVRDLEPDTPIAEDALRLETFTGPVKSELPVSRISDVKGRIVRARLRAGSVISLAILSYPPAVRRGDEVRVEVRSGYARLHFNAVAESPARKGEMVDLRNPLSGKTFRARMESDMTATVILGAGQKL